MVALALLSGPAAAECFTGQPHQVTYDSGPAVTIVGRDGEDVTVSRPDDAGPRVQVRHLNIFNRSTTVAGKTVRDHWFGHLPTLAELKPGAQFDVLGEVPASKGGTIKTELRVMVLDPETVVVDGCSYAVLVVEQRYFMNGSAEYVVVDYLNPDMLVTLRKELQPSGAGPISLHATRIE